MDLSPEEQKRVEEEVRRMVAELRSRPTQEKEDALGLEIARMPPPEREYVSVVLQRLLGVSQEGSGDRGRSTLESDERHG